MGEKYSGRRLLNLVAKTGPPKASPMLPTAVPNACLAMDHTVGRTRCPLLNLSARKFNFPRINPVEREIWFVSHQEVLPRLSSTERGILSPLFPEVSQARSVVSRDCHVCVP